MSSSLTKNLRTYACTLNSVDLREECLKILNFPNFENQINDDENEAVAQLSCCQVELFQAIEKPASMIFLKT